MNIRKTFTEITQLKQWKVILVLIIMKQLPIIVYCILQVGVRWFILEEEQLEMMMMMMVS